MHDRVCQVIKIKEVMIFEEFCKIDDTIGDLRWFVGKMREEKIYGKKLLTKKEFWYIVILCAEFLFKLNV